MGAFKGIRRSGYHGCGFGASAAADASDLRQSGGCDAARDAGGRPEGLEAGSGDAAGVKP